MPFLVECKWSFKIGSWDRMQIPIPFTRAKLIIARPIYVLAGASDREIENKRRELQLSLNGLASEGETWREAS